MRFQCHDTMGASVRSNKGIARSQYSPFSLYQGFKRTCDHVCDLVMNIMRMRGADRPFVKLNQY